MPGQPRRLRCGWPGTALTPPHHSRPRSVCDAAFTVVREDRDKDGFSAWQELVSALAVRLIDGGTCTHCGRATVLDDLETPVGTPALDVVTDGQHSLAMCWYQWDPELRTYRRSCEGDEPR